MGNKQANLIIFSLIAANLLYDLLLNPRLPGVIPSHWSLGGRADGASAKGVVYLTGLLPLLVFALLLNVLPRLRTSAPDIRPFQATFNYMIVAGAVMMFYVNVVLLQAALHPALSVLKLLLTGALLLLVLIGNVLGKTRPNPWCGIRTPWTQSSEAVWIATHRLAGRLWVGAASAGAALLWLGTPMSVLLPAVLVPVLLVPVVYSYLLFRQTGHGAG